ncbi:aminotransferase-like domain-containing protein [Aspergillus fijiensis CBS 313.89]|uniref:PLP-dependent transferase n=1 Tax=Aspergillus fijiensis CBS 313.89 TaxID=1448319 RepID=A0A8G1RUJ8_9EURO|nr:PLP-dependent transferase [Aspergillus fijiensis CBS 313.89]RAK78115.1 PLP-dependent transferase [Aspergillus fijiensis CBS 313.89]
MPPLQPASIKALRAQSEPLPFAIAPVNSSNAFKSTHTRSLPLAKRWDDHWSIESRGFEGSALKESANQPSDRKVISLGTGRPTADYYPWDSVTIESMPPTLAGEPSSHQTTIAKYTDTFNLANGLNYSSGAGFPHLLRFFTEHVEMMHQPRYSDWAVCLSCGSTSALDIAYRIFCNRGDTILTECYTYPGAVERAGLQGIRVQGVAMDAEGLRPDVLDEILRNWDTSASSKPRVLYMIPTGQNPTGVTQGLPRREQIYQIAETHDLIIIEDDPYYCLRLGMQCANELNGQGNGGDSVLTAIDRFQAQAVPSYLSIDRSGRVVRLDSTSKILAPGLRAGWVTASLQAIRKFVAYQEVSTLGVNGPTQLMLWKLLDETWGHEGFLLWLSNLSRQYQLRRDILVRACEKYLPRGLVSWNCPQYGMFLWLQLDYRQHPLLRHQTTTEFSMETFLVEMESRIVSRSLEQGVQVTKGSLFSPSPKRQGMFYIRLTSAAALVKDLSEGVKLLSDVLREEFALEAHMM